MKKRKLSNLNFKKSTISNFESKSTGGILNALPSKYGNHTDLTVDDPDGNSWFSLPYSNCCG